MAFRSGGGRSIALSVLSDQALVAYLRFQKEIRNWKVAVSFHCNEMLRTGLDAGWIATIGRYTVHSTLKSSGEVASSFKAAMTPDADVIVTGELDHQAHAYRFGMGLEWETGKEKPPERTVKKWQQRILSFLWSFGTKGVSGAT
jgi:hypothetical protein